MKERVKNRLGESQRERLFTGANSVLYRLRRGGRRGVGNVVPLLYGLKDACRQLDEVEGYLSELILSFNPVGIVTGYLKLRRYLKEMKVQDVAGQDKVAWRKLGKEANKEKQHGTSLPLRQL